jgi:hypothetical protein
MFHVSFFLFAGVFGGVVEGATGGGGGFSTAAAAKQSQHNFRLEPRLTRIDHKTD